MTATVTQVLGVARSQLGGYYPGTSPYGEWYCRKVGDHPKHAANYCASAYCAMFVSWCANQAGALDIIPAHSYTPSGAAWFKTNNQWHTGLTGVKAGDIVYFDFPNDGVNRISHVGIVESVNSNGTVNTIEGNTAGAAGGSQRNGRTVARKTRSSIQIVGYGRPTYKTTNPAPTAPAPSSSTKAGGYTVQILDLTNADKVPVKGTGLWVKKLQGLLKAHGHYDGAIDGSGGAITKAGLIGFQKAKNLVPDAICGALSWAALIEQ